MTALRAGKKPASVPAITNVMVACMAILISTVGLRKTVSVKTPASTVWFPATVFMYSVAAMPATIPIYPKKVVIVTLSAMISHEIRLSLVGSEMCIRDRHDITYTYDATQQSEYAYYPNGYSQNAHTFFLLQELGETVPHPDSAFVISCKPVVYADSFAVLLFKDFIFFFCIESSCHKYQIVQLVTFIIYEL